MSINKSVFNVTVDLFPATPISVWLSQKNIKLTTEAETLNMQLDDLEAELNESKGRIVE